MINKSFCIYFHHNNHCQNVVMGLYKPLFLHVGYLSKVLFPSYSTLTNQSNLLFRKKIWDWVIKNSISSLGSNYIRYFHERKIFPAKNLFRKLRKLTTNLEKSVVTKFAVREYFPREVLNKVVLLRCEIDLNTSVWNGVEWESFNSWLSMLPSHTGKVLRNYYHFCDKDRLL